MQGTNLILRPSLSLIRLLQACRKAGASRTTLVYLLLSGINRLIHTTTPIGYLS
jgi:hypothetical protein